MQIIPGAIYYGTIKFDSCSDRNNDTSTARPLRKKPPNELVQEYPAATY